MKPHRRVDVFLVLLLVLGETVFVVHRLVKANRSDEILLSAKDVDVGSVEQGLEVERDIVLENRGEKPVQVAATASCTCTIVQNSTLTVPPYGRATVRIRIDTLAVAGTNQGTITFRDASGRVVCTSRVSFRVASRAMAVPSLCYAQDGEFEFVVWTLTSPELQRLIATATAATTISCERIARRQWRVAGKLARNLDRVEKVVICDEEGHRLTSAFVVATPAVSVTAGELYQTSGDRHSMRVLVRSGARLDESKWSVGIEGAVLEAIEHANQNAVWLTIAIPRSASSSDIELFLNGELLSRIRQ